MAIPGTELDEAEDALLATLARANRQAASLKRYYGVKTDFTTYIDGIEKVGATFIEPPPLPEDPPAVRR